MTIGVIAASFDTAATIIAITTAITIATNIIALMKEASHGRNGRKSSRRRGDSKRRW